jgi:hypothetical protein
MIGSLSSVPADAASIAELVLRADEPGYPSQVPFEMRPE